MEAKASFCTIPYFIGPIPDEKLQTLYAMSEKQRGVFFAKLEEQKNSTVPLGSYPYFIRSTGWVQIWFTEDAKLSYEFMYSLPKSLTVVVESIKKNGKVSLWGRSEIFDNESGGIRLQENAWRMSITVEKAKEIIVNEETNWPKYVESLRKYEAKMRAKFEQQKLLETARTTSTLRKRGADTSTGGVQRTAKAVKRKATTRKLFPVKRSKLGKKTNQKAPKKPMNKGKTAPVVVVAVQKDQPKAMQAQKKSRAQAKNLTVDLCTPDAQVQNEALKQQQDYKATTMKKVVHCQKLEFLVNSDDEWNNALQDNPEKVMQKIIKFYAAHGTPDTLQSLCLRLLNAVTEEGRRREEAQFWRAHLVNKVRKVVNGYNKDLNRITKRIKTIDVPKTFDPKIVVRAAGGQTPHPTVTSPKDVEIIDVVAPDCDEEEQEEEEVDGPEGDADEDSIFGDPDSDEQEEEQEEEEGPKGDGLGVEEGEGVEESEEEGEVYGSYSRRALEDFQHTAQIPKRQDVCDNFVKLYPNGYPDDKDFVAHPHYLASTRSRSGFKHVTECETFRNENWLVKFGNTMRRDFEYRLRFN